MNQPKYANVKTVRNYKITAIETIQKTHEGTNMLIEDYDSIILNEKLFAGATEELALFDAMTEVNGMEFDMANVRWITVPFPG